MPSVVKLEMDTDVMVGKFPADSLTTGTQLVVYPSQTAFFVKGGRIFDKFEAGTYTLTTDNLPLLHKVINIPFGNSSPFQAEVWFVNQISWMDFKWGTQGACQIKDPLYNVIVKIRAFGQYALHIEDPLLFLKKIIGNMREFTRPQLSDYFRGILTTKITNIIYDYLLTSKQSIVDAGMYLEDISHHALEKLRKDFALRGVELEDFNIVNISIDETDASYSRLKKAIDKSAQIDIIGKEKYQMERSFNVMDAAASNSGGMAGVMASAMVGANIGNQMSGIATNLGGTSNAPQPSGMPQPSVAPQAAASGVTPAIVMPMTSGIKPMYSLYDCLGNNKGEITVKPLTEGEYPAYCNCSGPYTFEEMAIILHHKKLLASRSNILPNLILRYFGCNTVKDKLNETLDSLRMLLDYINNKELFDIYSKQEFIDKCKKSRTSVCSLVIVKSGDNTPRFYDELPEFAAGVIESKSDFKKFTSNLSKLVTD